MAPYWAMIGKITLLFIPISGHTGCTYSRVSYSKKVVSFCVQIDMSVEEANVSVIVLHCQNLIIFEDLLKVQDAGEKNIDIAGFGYEESTKFCLIHLAQPLQIGESIRLAIDFIAHLSDGLNGFYRSSYFNEDTNSTEIMATTKFGSIAARKALPCFDEPHFKATFQVNVGRVKDMRSISNMLKEKEGLPMSDNDEYVWDVYQETPNMSTYLLAAVVSHFDFRQSDQQESNVTFRIWSRESVKDQTKLAAVIGPKILSFYEEKFKTKFPLPKQDMIALPDFLTGAMENWGLITYREILLLNKPEESSASDKETTEIVVAHELSHQWFGNLVTMKWWSE